EHDELIGVKAEPHLAATRVRGHGAERLVQRARRIERVERVAEAWMRVERQELAGHAKGADAVRGAPVDAAGERGSVVARDLQEEGAPRLRRQRGGVARRRG